MVTTRQLLFCYIFISNCNNVPILEVIKMKNHLHLKNDPVKKSLILLFIALSTVFISCFEDQDDNITIASTSEINDFIWRGLNFFYLYKAETPELADDAFADDAAFNDFLNSYNSPEEFFAYLKAAPDNFSILVEDYIELENSLAGISLSNGMEFGLVLYPDMSGNVFGYIRYVLPNTDADLKELERGMIFNTVNGEQLNENNYIDLLSENSYTIGLATFDGTEVTSNGTEVNLIKTQYTENPIHRSTTLDINGRKIGYLMYNAFTNEFDNQLNNVFSQFKSDGVTDLVLDLRYNGGGSVRTATYLASMITGQNTGQVFYSEEWNADRQDVYANDGLFVSSFEGGGQAINSLMLNQVYVLTSSRTASASELVINGLTPYIDVVQIGTNTTGKYQASFLLYDAPAPNFSRSEANPGHRYAMLPLVFKTANASGFTNYDDGLIPDIDQPEDYSNLGQLGNPNEPLLATAISEITGLPAPIKSNTVRLRTISDSKAGQLGYQTMFIRE